MKSIHLIFTALTLICLGGVARADDRLWDAVRELCINTDMNSHKIEEKLREQSLTKTLKAKKIEEIDLGFKTGNMKNYEIIFNDIHINFSYDINAGTKGDTFCGFTVVKNSGFILNIEKINAISDALFVSNRFMNISKIENTSDKGGAYYQNKGKASYKNKNVNYTITHSSKFSKSIVRDKEGKFKIVTKKNEDDENTLLLNLKWIELQS